LLLCAWCATRWCHPGVTRGCRVTRHRQVSTRKALRLKFTVNLPIIFSIQHRSVTKRPTSCCCCRRPVALLLLLRAVLVLVLLVLLCCLCEQCLFGL
jgi:hypothetical protein